VGAQWYFLRENAELMTKPKPIIAIQMDEHRKWLHELARKKVWSYICNGPTGIGKSFEAERIFAQHGVRPVPGGTDMTRSGFIDCLRAFPHGLHFLDDFDGWMLESAFLNVMQRAAENKPRRTIMVRNRTTTRTGIDRIEFFGQTAIFSNYDRDNLPARVKSQVQSVCGRAKTVIISRDRQDLLDYLAWLISEEDYFRSEAFTRENNIGAIGLAAAQDVIDIIHTYAWWLETIDLRTLDTIAVARIHDPTGWKNTVRAMLMRTPVRQGEPPPAPILRGWNDRHGLSLPVKTKAAPGPTPRPSTGLGADDRSQPAPETLRVCVPPPEGEGTAQALLGAQLHPVIYLPSVSDAMDKTGDPSLGGQPVPGNLNLPLGTELCPDEDTAPAPATAPTTALGRTATSDVTLPGGEIDSVTYLLTTPISALDIPLAAVDDQEFARLTGEAASLEAACVIRRKVFAIVAALSDFLFVLDNELINHLRRRRSAKFWIYHANRPLTLIMDAAKKQTQSRRRNTDQRPDSIMP
jgi:hypothetical protein